MSNELVLKGQCCKCQCQRDSFVDNVALTASTVAMTNIVPAANVLPFE
jgi:hypothetical protein